MKVIHERRYGAATPELKRALKTSSSSISEAFSFASERCTVLFVYLCLFNDSISNLDVEEKEKWYYLNIYSGELRKPRRTSLRIVGVRTEM
jgi:hypothetical protein